MLLKNKLIKSGVSYSCASTCSAVCSMLIGFLNMRWLGPELLGIWQSITIINAYLPILQIGIQSGLNLELPVLLGGRKEVEAKEFVSTALFFAVCLASLFTIVSIIVVFILLSEGVDSKVLWGVVTICLMAIFSCFRLHYIATYRSANAFNKLALIYWVDCFVMGTMVFCIYKYQYFGLLIFQAVKDFAFTFLMFVFAPYRKVKPSFVKKCFLVLLKRGIFMTAFNEIKGIVESVPRVVLLKLGGTITVGLFNPALVVGTCVNLIPNQIAQFLHPQLGMKYGEKKQAKDMWPYFKALSIYVPICLIPVAVIGWFLIPFVIEYFFPKYLESLWPIRIMLIGFLFSTTYFARGFMITIKAYKEVVGLELLDLLLFGGLSVLFVEIFCDSMLDALAVALSISYFVTYIINIIVTYKTIYKSKYNIVQ